MSYTPAYSLTVIFVHFWVISFQQINRKKQHAKQDVSFYPKESEVIIKMRRYYLQDPEYKRTIDLTHYRELIEATVHEISPSTNVEVFKDHYTISPDISKGEVIKIGRKVAQSNNLGQYCIIRALLFKGENVKESSHVSELEKKECKKQKDNKKATKGGRRR